MIKAYLTYTPKLATTAWIASDADVIGRVTLEDDVSVWFHAVIRGDSDTIFIGKGSNIQDGSILHTDLSHQLVIEEDVTIGHGCIIHGCHIGSNTLVGMGAIILNGARIGSNCIIGAGAVVTEQMEIPSGSLVVGCPAKIIKQVTSEQIQQIKENALHYQALAKEYQKEEGGSYEGN